MQFYTWQSARGENLISLLTFAVIISFEQTGTNNNK